MKAVVQDAADTYDLISTRRVERERAELKINLLMGIVQIAQQADSTNDCLLPIAKAVGESLAANRCILQLVENKQLLPTQGDYIATEKTDNFLGSDPLVTEAITSQKIQIWSKSLPGDNESIDLELYQSAGVEVHVVAPIIYRTHTVAILSIQWQNNQKLTEEILELITLSSQQITLALVSTGFC
ncbi:MAG: GAF domain-containing protein [Okeania sp. SIO2D1]|nr:GAF domain-containing protein [Okeania sp. SIO2D1]